MKALVISHELWAFKSRQVHPNQSATLMLAVYHRRNIFTKNNGRKKSDSEYLLHSSKFLAQRELFLFAVE